MTKIVITLERGIITSINHNIKRKDIEAYIIEYDEALDDEIIVINGNECTGHSASYLLERNDKFINKVSKVIDEFESNEKQ